MNADSVFWLCLAIAAYAFAGYPVFAIALARRRKTMPSAPPASVPSITVVLAARNEARRMRTRIQNLLDSDYPADCLQILVVDDGSDDGSAEIARSFGHRRIRVLRLPQPSGKALALNAAMAQVRTPVTVFADARQQFHACTLAALVMPLSDPTIAVVSGEVHIQTADAGGHAVAADGSYARIERALRQAESRLSWAHAACGAVYAIKTSVFRPLPAGLLLDDVYTPIQALRQGFKIHVAPAAVAMDVAGHDLRLEFRRKLRTLTGNWQLLALQPWLLNPFANPAWFAWVSHKFIRLLAPWALIGALLASAVALGPIPRIAFWLQLAAYAIAAATLLAPRLMRHVPLATTAGSFVALNAAALLSLPMYLRQRDLRGLWKA